MRQVLRKPILEIVGTCRKVKMVYYPQVGHLGKGQICLRLSEQKTESNEYEVRASDGRTACTATADYSTDA